MRRRAWPSLQARSHRPSAFGALAIQPGEESGCNAPKAVHCPHRDRGPPRCWGQGGRAHARLAQELFRPCQDSGAQWHEEFSERAASRVMSAIGPKRTSLAAPHMSAFGGKADMALCGISLSRSLLGEERTWACALHMSAFDPKRTWAGISCGNPPQVDIHRRGVGFRQPPFS